jgi:hypothetical protein
MLFTPGSSSSIAADHFLLFAPASCVIIKRQMTSTLDFKPFLSVLKEPPIPDSALCTGSRVTSHGDISDDGLTVVSLASKKACETSAQARRALSTQTASVFMLDLTQASLQTILNKPAQIKTAKHTPLFNVPFIPLVISLEGSVENSAM